MSIHNNFSLQHGTGWVNMAQSHAEACTCTLTSWLTGSIATMAECSAPEATMTDGAQTWRASPDPEDFFFMDSRHGLGSILSWTHDTKIHLPSLSKDSIFAVGRDLLASRNALIETEPQILPANPGLSRSKGAWAANKLRQIEPFEPSLRTPHAQQSIEISILKALSLRQNILIITRGEVASQIDISSFRNIPLQISDEPATASDMTWNCTSFFSSIFTQTEETSQHFQEISFNGYTWKENWVLRPQTPMTWAWGWIFAGVQEAVKWRRQSRRSSNTSALSSFWRYVAMENLSSPKRVGCGLWAAEVSISKARWPSR